LLSGPWVRASGRCFILVLIEQQLFCPASSPRNPPRRTSVTAPLTLPAAFRFSDWLRKRAPHENGRRPAPGQSFPGRQRLTSVFALREQPAPCSPSMTVMKETTPVLEARSCSKARSPPGKQLKKALTHHRAGGLGAAGPGRRLQSHRGERRFERMIPLKGRCGRRRRAIPSRRPAHCFQVLDKTSETRISVDLSASRASAGQKVGLSSSFWNCTPWPAKAIRTVSSLARFLSKRF